MRITNVKLSDMPAPSACCTDAKNTKIVYEEVNVVNLIKAAANQPRGQGYTTALITSAAMCAISGEYERIFVLVGNDSTGRGIVREVNHLCWDGGMEYDVDALKGLRADRGYVEFRGTRIYYVSPRADLSTLRGMRRGKQMMLFDNSCEPPRSDLWGSKEANRPILEMMKTVSSLGSTDFINADEGFYFPILEGRCSQGLWWALELLRFVIMDSRFDKKNVLFVGGVAGLAGKVIHMLPQKNVRHIVAPSHEERLEIISDPTTCVVDCGRVMMERLQHEADRLQEINKGRG